MKKALLIFVIGLFSINVFAQNEIKEVIQDVIYLTNGLIHRGKIIDTTAEYILIKTNKGTYKIPYSNVEKISQEKIDLINTNNQSNFQLKSIPYRNPGIATFMSLLIPGGGQFYNAQSAKGIGFFLWGAGSASLLTYSAFGGFENNNETIAILSGISYLACWTSSMLDAERTAKYINDGYLATFNLGNNKTLALNPDVRLVNSNSNYIKNNSILSYGINFKLSF